MSLNIIYSIIIILLGMISFIGINKILNKFIKTKYGKNDILHRIIIFAKVLNFVVVSFVCLLFILNVFGVTITKILTGVGVGGIIFTIVGKDFLTNTIASIIFIMNGVIEIGEKIKVGTIEGKIVEITINYVKLKDKNGNYINFPNKKLAGEPVEHITNFSEEKIQKVKIVSK